MTFNDFNTSLAETTPPPGISVYLQSLWYDGKNDWEKSHEIIQDINDKSAAWIHAYLHRKEGDVFNANYWYNRAGRKMPGYALEKEWREIVEGILKF